MPSLRVRGKTPLTAAVAPTALLLRAIDVPSPPQPPRPSSLLPVTKPLSIGGANNGEEERSPSDGSQNHFARSLAPLEEGKKPDDD